MKQSGGVFLVSYLVFAGVQYDKCETDIEQGTHSI